MSAAPRVLRHSRACPGVVDLVALPLNDAYQLVCSLHGDIGYIPTPLLVARGLVRPPSRPAPAPADCPDGLHPYELTRHQDRWGRPYCDGCRTEREQHTKARGAAIPRQRRTG
jgi:hypothetical protein